MDEPNAGAVVRTAMAVMAIRPGCDAPGEVDDEVALTPLSQIPMMFQNSEVETLDRVGTLETAVDDTVDRELPPEYAKMLRNIGFCTHLDVFRRALLGDPPARVESMAVRLRPGARAVLAKSRASPPVMTA